MHCPVDTGRKLNVHKIDAKLTKNGKGNAYHVVTHYFRKQSKFTQDINLFFLIFFNGSQDIAQSIEERKVAVLFIAISIVIPAVQLLTRNINKELQKRLWNTIEHLRWNLFEKKLHYRCLTRL